MHFEQTAHSDTVLTYQLSSVRLASAVFSKSPQKVLSHFDGQVQQCSDILMDRCSNTVTF